MAKYYIKKHLKTLGDYPSGEGIHFSQRAFHMGERFATCAGFLLYEAVQGDRPGLQGAKCVYGYGHVVAGPKVAHEVRVVDGREYPFVVPIVIEKSLQDRTLGIPLTILRDQFGIQMRPTLGGLVEISEDVFKRMQEHIDELTLM